MTDPRVTAALAAFGEKNNPETLKKLLTAIAHSGSAIANRHDTILLGAVGMIEAFEKIVVSADYTGTSGDRS
jgi:hypothetical protein